MVQLIKKTKEGTKGKVSPNTSFNLVENLYTREVSEETPKDLIEGDTDTEWTFDKVVQRKVPTGAFEGMILKDADVNLKPDDYSRTDENLGTKDGNIVKVDLKKEGNQHDACDSGVDTFGKYGTNQDIVDFMEDSVGDEDEWDVLGENDVAGCLRMDSPVSFGEDVRGRDNDEEENTAKKSYKLAKAEIWDFSPVIPFEENQKASSSQTVGNEPKLKGDGFKGEDSISVPSPNINSDGVSSRVCYTPETHFHSSDAFREDGQPSVLPTNTRAIYITRDPQQQDQCDVKRKFHTDGKSKANQESSLDNKVGKLDKKRVTWSNQKEEFYGADVRYSSSSSSDGVDLLDEVAFADQEISDSARLISNRNSNTVYVVSPTGVVAAPICESEDSDIDDDLFEIMGDSGFKATDSSSSCDQQEATQKTSQNVSENSGRPSAADRRDDQGASDSGDMVPSMVFRQPFRRLSSKENIDTFNIVHAQQEQDMVYIVSEVVLGLIILVVSIMLLVMF